MPENKSNGLRLQYSDFKLLNEILESIDLTKREKHLLWKVKTILHNMDMARLRKREEKPEETEDAIPEK
jgi:hypothetical protein